MHVVLALVAGHGVLRAVDLETALADPVGVPAGGHAEVVGIARQLVVRLAAQHDVGEHAVAVGRVQLEEARAEVGQDDAADVVGDRDDRDVVVACGGREAVEHRGTFWNGSEAPPSGVATELLLTAREL